MRGIFLFVSINFLLFSNILSVPSDFEYAVSPVGTDVGGIINKTLSDIIGNISDPLTVSNFSENFNNAIITGPVSISDLELTGIHSIAASVLTLDYRILYPTLLNITLGVKDINLFLNYDMNVLLLQVLPFFGRGNISLNLDDINIEFSMSFKLVLTPFSIKEFKNTFMEFSLGKDTSGQGSGSQLLDELSIEGLLYSDDFSDLLNDVIAEYGALIIDFLDVNKDRIGKLLSSILQSILDGLDKNDYYMHILSSILEKAVIDNNY